MYKILIKYDNDKLNLWMPYGTTTTSTTGKSEFTEFETDDVTVLKETILKLDKEYGFDKFAIAGGVASNSSLRAAFETACAREKISFYHPSPIFCTDNAAMIGVAAYYEYINGTRSGWDLNAVPNLKLGER